MKAQRSNIVGSQPEFIISIIVIVIELQLI